MRRAKVVIGANYGDEGKGLFTDYYVSKAPEKALVVRFNGGAQAGHTVTTPDGRRHVFSHFGSGSFLGAHTYLLNEFIGNPILFHAELTKLLALGIKPRLLASRHMSITTPMDMWLNMAAEDARGADRHGSVGVGIWETQVRSENFDDITFGSLVDGTILRTRLENIVKNWMPKRADELGCREAFDTKCPKFDLNRFIADCETFAAYIRPTALELLAGRYRNVVFEGAQGLGLGQHKSDKYSTPSNTGLTNIINSAYNSLGISELDVTYVTRSYLTRHGAGVLERETPDRPFEGIVDHTNKPHPYQGTLRFGLLDVDTLHARIAEDFQTHADDRWRIRIGVTCLDQVGPEHRWFEDGEEQRGNRVEFLEAIGQSVSKLMTSHGPTRSTIRDIGDTTCWGPQERKRILCG